MWRRVDDIEAALAELKQKGVRLIDETPAWARAGPKLRFCIPKPPPGCWLNYVKDKEIPMKENPDILKWQTLAEKELRSYARGAPHATPEEIDIKPYILLKI
ncbi:MAG: hypothetical protein R2874_01155 [Desulfobacterales bacterium]